MTTRENPDAAPPVDLAEPTPLEASAPESLATAPEPVLLENPRAVAVAPSESMEGAVTVERERVTIEAHEVGSVAELGLGLELEPATPDAEPTTLENPKPPPSAPSEGSEDVVTLEAPPAAPAASSPAPAVAPFVPPQPVRGLPRRARLRATFHYDAHDDLHVELTLMDDRRELIHRMAMSPTPGGAIARIFDALLGVVTQAAAAAGVFGSRER